MVASKKRVAASLAVAAFAGAAFVAGWLTLGSGSGSPAPLIEDLAATVVMTKGTPTVAVTASIRNAGPPDRLIAVEAQGAKFAMLAGEEDMAGLPIPAGGGATLAMDGAHVMLMGLAEAPEEGRLIPITLTFEKSGRIAAKARVAAPTGISGMDHGAGFDIDAASAPAVSIRVEPTEAGWRVIADVERFRFAPEAMDGPHVLGEGHGHLYIGGLKILRMTSPQVEIGALPPGRHVLRVSLNTNDHREYRVANVPVAATTELTAP